MPVIHYKPEMQCDFTTSLHTHTSKLESSEKQHVKICIRVQFSFCVFRRALSQLHSQHK